VSPLRTGLSEEDRSPDLVHVTADDVTEARTPTPEQARAIGLLELNPSGLPVPRLSLAQWRHVDRVVRTLGSLGIPTPRQALDGVTV
jgi:hypothetical protein